MMVFWIIGGWFWAIGCIVLGMTIATYFKRQDIIDAQRYRWLRDRWPDADCAEEEIDSAMAKESAT